MGYIQEIIDGPDVDGNESCAFSPELQTIIARGREKYLRKFVTNIDPKFDLVAFEGDPEKAVKARIPYNEAVMVMKIRGAEIAPLGLNCDGAYMLTICVYAPKQKRLIAMFKQCHGLEEVENSIFCMEIE